MPYSLADYEKCQREWSELIREAVAHKTQGNMKGYADAKRKAEKVHRKQTKISLELWPQ